MTEVLPKETYKELEKRAKKRLEERLTKGSGKWGEKIKTERAELEKCKQAIELAEAFIETLSDSRLQELLVNLKPVDLYSDYEDRGGCYSEWGLELSSKGLRFFDIKKYDGPREYTKESFYELAVRMLYYKYTAEEHRSVLDVRLWNSK